MNLPEVVEMERAWADEYDPDVVAWRDSQEGDPQEADADAFFAAECGGCHRRRDLCVCVLP